MNHQPLVSIALCTYNGSVYLGEQLDSICRQTYQQLEIIVVDDHSADNTIEIIQLFAKNDGRIRFYQNDSTLGHNLNFDKACRLCTGDFIAIADQDDIWMPEKIDYLLKRIQLNPGNILVHCISAHFTKQGKPSMKSIQLVNYYKDCHPAMFFLANPISGHTMLFKKELLSYALPFPETIYYDWWLAIYASCIGRIDHEDSVLVWHRFHAFNASGAAKPVVPFYQQTITNLTQILQISEMNMEDKQMAQELIKLNEELDKRKFSFRLFVYILKNARIFFAFKRRRVPYLSYLKHSIRASLKWTKA